MADEPFDARSGGRSNNPAPPPSSAFAHSASTTAAPRIVSPVVERTSFSGGERRPSPPAESFGLPQRWSQYERDVDSAQHLPDSSNYNPESTRAAAAAAAERAGARQYHQTSDESEGAASNGHRPATSTTSASVTPSKYQSKSHYNNYEMFDTPSPATNKRASTPMSSGGAAGTPYSMRRSESYDTAELIKKYSQYRAPPPSIRPPSARMASPVQTQQDHIIRSQAMKLLDMADDHLKMPLDVRRTASGGFRAAPAMAVASSNNDAPYNVHRTPSGSIVREPRDESSSLEPYDVRRTGSAGHTKRVPSALAGLNMTQEERRHQREFMGVAGAANRNPARFPQPGRYSFRDPTYHDDDAGISDEEDEILSGQEVLDELVDEMLDYEDRRARAPFVDVARLDNRSASSRIGKAGMPKVPESEPSTSWSSRYVSDFMADWAKDDVMNQLGDRDSDRQRQTARNMFASSAHNIKTAVEVQKGKVFGAGFSFRQNHVFGHHQDSVEKPDVNLRTVWKDVGENLDPMPTTTARKSWQEAMLNKQKRRRFIIVLVLLLSALVIVSATVIRNKSRAGQLGAAQAMGDIPGAVVSFYATSDVPYNADEEIKLKKDLANLPVDAEFVVHLGNIQDASISMCPKTRYSDVASVLSKSPVPMFVLPGEEDWEQCPNPTAAFINWFEAFNFFEHNFVHGFQVYRPRDRPEIFAMLHKGVLFAGLHLVSGPASSSEERSALELDMLKFFFGMLNLHKDQFRAVVVLGNARPGPPQKGFFDGLLTSIKPIGKPFLYMNANSGSGEIRQYTPFQDHPEVTGIEILDGGQNPPIRVTVGFGDRPFMLG